MNNLNKTNIMTVYQTLDGESISKIMQYGDKTVPIKYRRNQLPSLEIINSTPSADECMICDDLYKLKKWIFSFCEKPEEVIFDVKELIILL